MGYTWEGYRDQKYCDRQPFFFFTDIIIPKSLKQRKVGFKTKNINKKVQLNL